jgi:hypothetical protein|tara:strand:- start:253 stop:549 length:297 start_codon:yes stop_codon:yes gene_type:complete
MAETHRWGYFHDKATIASNRFSGIHPGGWLLIRLIPFPDKSTTSGWQGEGARKGLAVVGRGEMVVGNCKRHPGKQNRGLYQGYGWCKQRRSEQLLRGD